MVVVTAEPSPAENELKLASLSRFHFKTAQYDRALQAAQTWVGQAPANAAAQMQLGDVQLAMGQRQAAWTAYWRALDLARTEESEEPPTAILTRLDRLVRQRTR
jgi:predicted negative regulator of RcsB-dependent stress response